MADIYKPGAVSSLIQFETSATEKSKEQKKLDKLFGKSTKFSPSSISQVASLKDVSTNLTIDLKSSKKKKKSKTDLCSEEPVLSSTKIKKLTDKNDQNKSGKKKKDKKNKLNVVKEKKRNSDDISSPSIKKTKKFKEITPTETVDDKQNIKKAKKRKRSSEEVTEKDGEKDDGVNQIKRKKFDKKNNKITNGTNTAKPRSSDPKIKKGAPPVINDVLCALKESDGSKTRKRTAPKAKDLSDLEDEAEQVSKRRKKKRDKTNDNRTVFVGNLPLTISKKELKRLFSPCGVVETLRMRGAIPANPHRGKKYAILKQAYHSKCRSINAYICFADKESADNACQLMNGKEVEGQHIRVNSSVLDKTAHDHKRSVFIGNLPFAISDEEVRNHFLDCGEIANIRLVKDWKTGIGKGFGYVKFEEVDSADLAVKLDNSQLKNRKIRVQPSEADPKKKRADKGSDKGSKGPEKTTKVKKSDQKDFVGIKAEKKKKKKSKPKHLARKMGLATKKKDLPPVKPVEKVTGGPNKHMVFE